MTSKLGLFACALFFIVIFLMTAYEVVVEPTIHALGG